MNIQKSYILEFIVILINFVSAIWRHRICNANFFIPELWYHLYSMENWTKYGIHLACVLIIAWNDTQLLSLAAKKNVHSQRLQFFFLAGVIISICIQSKHTKKTKEKNTTFKHPSKWNRLFHLLKELNQQWKKKVPDEMRSGETKSWFKWLQHL